MEDSVEVLEAKLAEHKIQLIQVEDLIRQTPEDESLKKLYGDLCHVISLTKDLLKLKASPSVSTIPSTPQIPTQVTASAASVPTRTRAPPPPFSATPNQLVQQYQTHQSSLEHKWQVGDRCLALWTDQKYYSARIDFISEVRTYHVTYLDYGNTAEVPESSLLTYVPAPADKLKSGTLVRAIWPEDGLFYDSVIESVGSTAGYYIVKFSKYKKCKLEVNGYDIVLRKEHGTAWGEETKDGFIPEKPVIPDALKPAPNDTEAQKQAKLKKIKRIKSKHRKMKMEMAGQEKRNNWQEFQQKGASPLSQSGFLRGKKRKSIFASPTDVDGRVGVTGSGQKMTTYRDLTRHKFSKITPPSTGDEEDSQSQQAQQTQPQQSSPSQSPQQTQPQQPSPPSVPPSSATTTPTQPTQN